MSPSIAGRRTFRPSPDHLPLALIVLDAFLLLSERMRWYVFGAQKGWPVLIALAAVGLVGLVIPFWLAASLVFDRPFQFTLRSLLAMTVVVAIPFSWLATELRRARRQRDAVAAIEAMAGQVGYRPERDEATSVGTARRWLQSLLGEDFFADVVSVGGPLAHDGRQYWRATDTGLECLKALSELREVSLADTAVTDAALLHVAALRNLEQLHLRDTKVTDAGLECIEGLTMLRELDLSGTAISDAGLASLGTMKKLRVLGLNSTGVTDAGLRHLASLNALESLGIWGTGVTGTGLEELNGLKHLTTILLFQTEVTDAGLKHIEGLTQLQKLDLMNTRVTDAGLDHLARLTNLRELNLGTLVTDAGVKKLQLALPNCTIKR